MRTTLRWIAGVFMALAACPALACEGAVAVCPEAQPGAFPLIHGDNAVAVETGPDAHPAVVRAARAFERDVAAVRGAGEVPMPDLVEGAETLVIVGELDDPAIAALIADGKLDGAAIDGAWEGYVQAVVENPRPGVERALVIAGTDPRGVVYGLYDLSERIGVSPWRWWADVPVERREALWLTAGSRSDAPAVRYRGFFINDEEPALGNWAREKFGGVNAQFYDRVFDLLLRLKGNYLWPAMWGKSLAEDDPATLALAAETGVVLGTSHHEPLMRAHVDWERAKEADAARGAWNYAENGAVLREFWRTGMERFAGSGADGVVTIGMRGDGDEAMSEDTAIGLLERVVEDQREIIARTTGRATAETPQVWALYKEVQDYYDQGMRVPDDVILLFADDNWGQIRRLPDPEAPPRAGGYGVYYHFDYVGVPRSYKWLDTIQNGKTWQQMDLAWQRGARDLWIVNVGDIKPAEAPLDFFLDMAWNPPAMTPEALDGWSERWAQQQFGPAHAVAIGAIVEEYARLAARRKPELVDAEALSRGELHAVADEWGALAQRATAVADAMPAHRRHAYFQLVLHRVLALGNIYRLHEAVALNRQAAAANDPVANVYADVVANTFAFDEHMSRTYHTMGEGKWNHMMSQPKLGYTSWDDPDADIMPELARVEGAGAASGRGAQSEPSPSRARTITVDARTDAAVDSGGQVGWVEIRELGRYGSALVSLPQGAAPTTVADAIVAEFAFDAEATGDHRIEVALSPTLNTLGDAPMRLGIQVDDRPVEVLTYDLEATGTAQDTPEKRAWAQAVTDNLVRLETVARDLARGSHRLRLYRIDDNVVIDHIAYEPVARR